MCSTTRPFPTIRIGSPLYLPPSTGQTLPMHFRYLIWFGKFAGSSTLEDESDTSGTNYPALKASHTLKVNFDNGLAYFLQHLSSGSKTFQSFICFVFLC
jgi:hypothetical protein